MSAGSTARGTRALGLDVADCVISKAVERWAEVEPDRVCAVEDGGGDLTYGDLDLRASAIAAGLRARGVEAGDRVVTLFEANGLRSIYLPVALAKLGAIEVPVNPALRGPSLAHILGDVSPRAAVVDGALVPGFLEALPARDRPLIVHASRADTETGAEVTLDEMLSDAGDQGIVTEALGWDPGAIMYTSGTTGMPKGAVMPHRHLLRYGERTADLIDLTADDTMLTVLPLFHAGGRGMNLIACLLAGSRCVLVPRFSASAFWDQARDHDATTFHVVLSMAHFILAQPPSPDDRAHSIARGIIGPPTEDVANAFSERFGVRVVCGYASTEANIAVINPDGPVVACGRPSPPYRVWVVDAHDRSLPPGEVGEMVVACDDPWSMFSGYWGQPADSLEALRNFAFHTGDAAYVDDDGYVWFVDRMKDVIRRRGENISATQVENAVNSIAGVIESAAYGVPSPHGEDEVAIAVVAQPDVELTADDVAEACRQQLPSFAIPAYVRFADSLPKTETGKIKKVELKRQGADGAVELQEA